MKIDKTDVSQSHLLGQSKKTESRNPALDFNKVLKQQLESTPEISSAHSSRLQLMIGLSSVSPSVGSSESVQRVEQVLDTVSQYEQLLDDPGVTLRNIEPTVRHMAMQVASLKQVLQSLPADNPIRPVLEETRALVCKEIERFDSGYYVDP